MVRRPRLVASLVALGAGMAAPSLLRTARADQTAWSLVWEAPAECPSEASVRDAVAQLLGTGAPPPASVSARAVVLRTSSDHWVVQLTTVREGARGERVVEAASCPSLANATALIVALTIDPERVAAHAPGSPPSSATASAAPVPTAAASTVAPLPSAQPSGAPAPPPPSPPSSSSSSAPTPTPALTPTPAPAPASAPRRFALLLEGMGDQGSLPRLSDGLSASFALTFDALRLEAFGSYLFAQAANTSQFPSIGSNIDLWAVGLRGCYLPAGGAVAVGACAGMELGQLHGSGFGSLRGPYDTFTPGSDGGLWIAPVVGGRLAWRIAPYFSLVIDLGLAIPLRRDAFQIDAAGTVHQASFVVVRGAAGPELRF